MESLVWDEKSVQRNLKEFHCADLFGKALGLCSRIDDTMMVSYYLAQARF